MRYIKKFESLIDNDEFKNKILLIDASASFQYDLRTLMDKNLYLADKITVLFCSSFITDRCDITLDELKELVDSYRCSGSDGMQLGIDFIVKRKLEGPILVFSDGYFEIDISKLSNDISVISTDSKPKIVGGDCDIFIKNIDTTNYYAPRDCKSIDEYEARKSSKKYNI